MSLEAIAVRFRPAITAYFARRVSDRAEVEDLTQEVLAGLVRRSDISDVANIDGYVFQVAANVLRDRARRVRRRPLEFGASYDLACSVLADELSPDRVIAARDEYAALVRALQEMPERMRTIFVLNRFEDMSGKEIAVRLGLSVSAVEKTMMRAVGMLRERFR